MTRTRARRGKLPRVLTEDEQRRFLEAFDTRFWTPYRDRVACLAMLDAGLRVSEACALELDHVDMAARRITVRDGKGGVDRRVPIPPRLAEALEEWLDRRTAYVDNECPYVFPTRAGEAVHPNQMRRTVTRMVERAGLPEAERISPHTLRHSFATDVLNHTGNLELVRHLLGHADISTTTIYLHLADHDVEAELTANGFRSKEKVAEPGPVDEVEALREQVTALAEKVAELSGGGG